MGGTPPDVRPVGWQEALRREGAGGAGQQSQGGGRGEDGSEGGEQQGKWPGLRWARPAGAAACEGRERGRAVTARALQGGRSGCLLRAECRRQGREPVGGTVVTEVRGCRLDGRAARGWRKLSGLGVVVEPPAFAEGVWGVRDRRALWAPGGLS